MQYIQEIKEILSQARQKTYQAINSAMVEAYWSIGKRIVQEEQNGKEKATYGEAILKTLSKALTAEFGKGFAYANLYNMRQFYVTYKEDAIFYTLCRKLTWSHNRLIMRVDNIEARNYYLTEASQQQWSVRTLERNINTMYFNRLLTNTNNTKANNFSINDFVKDPYIFEFLNIAQPNKANENEIEVKLIDNLQHFLMELGKGFSYIGRQQRISTETEHYYIDLVFYNYLLKCFVLFDLKMGKLTHQDIGQMDMYRRLYDDFKKPENDNSTIGIILCTEKSETVVKYSIMNETPQLVASKFWTYLPTEQELINEIEHQKTLLKLHSHE